MIDVELEHVRSSWRDNVSSRPPRQYSIRSRHLLTAAEL
jgi:hypothetical protein